jgi:hypothetical protein
MSRIHCIEIKYSTGDTFGSGDNTVVLANYWHSYKLAKESCDLIMGHSDEYNRKHCYYGSQGKEIDRKAPYTMRANDFTLWLPMYYLEYGEEKRSVSGSICSHYNGYFESLISANHVPFESRGEAMRYYELTGSDSERFISVKTLQQDAYISDITIDSNWRSHDDESSY